MAKKYKHLLFDLDRTLWDFETNAKHTLLEIYENFGLKHYCPYFEEFIDKYKAVNEQLWKDYRDKKITQEELSRERFHYTFKYFGLDDVELGEKAGQFYLEKSAEKTILFDGTIETLEKLRPYYKIHIVTNGFKQVQQGKIKNCGLTSYVDNLITSEDAGFQKPDIRIFEHTLHQIDACKEECIMIGDDEKTDIKGASDFQIDSIWFNPGNRKSDSNLFTKQIRSLKELTAIL